MFRPLRARRKQRLLEAHLLPFEANTLTGVALKQPYMKALMRERRNEYRLMQREAAFNQWSAAKFKAEWTAHIRKRYKDNKWFITKAAVRRLKTVGKADPWAMLKDWRQRAIDSGEYLRPKGKKKDRSKLDHDAVLREKARYRERHREEIRERGREYRQRIKAGTGLQYRLTEEDKDRYADEHGH